MPFAIPARHAKRPRTPLGVNCSRLSLPSEPAARKFGSSPTARGTEAEVSSTTTGCLRQTVLGSCQAILVRLETESHLGDAGNGCALAPCRICSLLESDFQGPASKRQEVRF
jgi:hypothetical protein